MSHLIYQIFKIKESETGASEEKIDRTLFFCLQFVHNSQTKRKQKCVRIVLYFRKMGRDTKGEDKNDSYTCSGR